MGVGQFVGGGGAADEVGEKSPASLIEEPYITNIMNNY